MPTLEGAFFVPLGLYCFFRYPGYLLPLLIVSTAFQASTIFISDSVNISPYYFLAALFILRFVRDAMNRSSRGKGSFTAPLATLAAFGVFAVASGLLLPFVFSGTPVWEPRRGMEGGFFHQEFLRFQMGNVAQALLLTINVLVVVAAARQSEHLRWSKKAFAWTFWIVVSVLAVQIFCFQLGLPFPSSLLNNNRNYQSAILSAAQSRPNGSFIEPSMAGAALAAFSGAYLSSFLAGKSSIYKGTVAVIACLLVASSSSLVALAFLLSVLVLSRPIFRWPWYLNLVQLKRLSIFLVGGFCAAALLLLPSTREILLSQTLEKGESSSALVRLGADAFAFDLVRQTYGLGVGLGSNRPSSLIASLMSQVGVPGFLLFCFAVVKLLKATPKDERWICWAALGLLLDMSLGLPDLSFPLLWILLALAAQSAASHPAAEGQRALLRQDRPAAPHADALPS